MQQHDRAFVLALGIVFVKLDLDALVAVDRGQHLVQCVAGRDDVSGAQRARALGKGPHLDHHVLRKRRLHYSSKECAGKRSCNRKLPVHELPPHWSWHWGAIDFDGSILSYLLDVLMAWRRQVVSA